MAQPCADPPHAKIVAGRKGMNFSGVWNTRWFKGIFRNLGRNRLKVDYTNTSSTYGRPMTDYEFNERKAERQRKIDEILEKISKSGYESLTGEEKDLLFRSSNSGR